MIFDIVTKYMLYMSFSTCRVRSYSAISGDRLLSAGGLFHFQYGEGRAGSLTKISGGCGGCRLGGIKRLIKLTKR